MFQISEKNKIKGHDLIGRVLFNDHSNGDSEFSNIFIDRHYKGDVEKLQLSKEEIIEIIGEDEFKYGRMGRTLTKDKLNEIVQTLADGDLKNEYPQYTRMLKSKMQRQIEVEEDFIVPVPVKAPGFREVHYIVGPSGAGKSSWCVRYILMWAEMFPELAKKKRIFRFSRIEHDKTFDRLGRLDKPDERLYKNVLINESLLENPITLEDVKNSLLVFDDVDSIQDEALKDMIHKLRNDVLETGRHHNIYVLNTSHKVLNWNSTRSAISEATAVTFFPKSGTTGSIRDFLSKKCGYDKKTIDSLMHLPSLWVTVYMTYPNYAIYEKGVKGL